MPVPTEAESSSGSGGGRSTSPCTSFQPLSSCSSSFSSIELYRLRSRRSVRIMIIATMPVSNRTIASELRMENQ